MEKTKELATYLMWEWINGQEDSLSTWGPNGSSILKNPERYHDSLADWIRTQDIFSSLSEPEFDELIEENFEKLLSEACFDSEEVTLCLTQIIIDMVYMECVGLAVNISPVARLLEDRLRNNVNLQENNPTMELTLV
jgi:hypothetical protein